MKPARYKFDKLQKIAMSLMAVLMVVTFVGANLHALMWQSSDWLVSTVLPAVVVDMTNQERVENSAGTLQRNTTLDEAATLKAEHMAKNEYFAHHSPDGVSPWYWFKEAGYTYAHAGENLAIHFTDSTEVVEAWMDSPTHRANIVNGIYTEIGVGTAKGKYEGYDTVYVVQLFGTPAEVPIIKSDPKPVPTEPELAVAKPVPVSTQLPVQLPQPQEEILGDVVLYDEPEKTNISDEESASVSESYQITDEVIVVGSPIIATSSGLAVAQITVLNEFHAGATIGAVATQPNTLLQFIYFMLAAVVCVLLSVSIVLEVRRFHLVQVAYSLMLLAGMGSLWYVHLLLTDGAVIA